MSKTRVYALIFVCLFIGFVTGFCAKMFSDYMKTNKNQDLYQQYPRKSLLVKIRVNQYPDLIDATTRFANDRGFAIRVAPLSPDHLDFVIDMWRYDLHIYVSKKLGTETSFQVDFYDTDRILPPHAWSVSLAASQLKGFLEDIPDVEITE